MRARAGAGDRGTVRVVSAPSRPRPWTGFHRRRFDRVVATTRELGAHRTKSPRVAAALQDAWDEHCGPVPVDDDRHPAIPDVLAALERLAATPFDPRRVRATRRCLFLSVWTHRRLCDELVAPAGQNGHPAIAGLPVLYDDLDDDTVGYGHLGMWASDAGMRRIYVPPAASGLAGGPGAELYGQLRRRGFRAEQAAALAVRLAAAG